MPALPPALPPALQVPASKPRKPAPPLSRPAAEDALLEQAHAAGMRIAELARAHERTSGAITARLVRLGRIESPPGLRLRGTSAPGEGASTA